MYLTKSPEDIILVLAHPSDSLCLGMDLLFLQLSVGGDVLLELLFGHRIFGIGLQVVRELLALRVFCYAILVSQLG